MAATLQFHLAAPIKSHIQRSKTFSNAITYRKSAKVRCSAAALPTKRSYTITLLPGDGIGPEIVSVAKDVLTHAGSLEDIEIKYQEKLIGGCAFDATGAPLPEETLSAAKQSDAVLLGAIGGYKWDKLESKLKPETGLLQLRAGLDVFANLRPATVLPQLIDSSTLKREIAEGVDLMVVRELTGGIYFGKPRGFTVNDKGEETGFNTEVYSISEIDRIARVAFETARKRRRKLCSVDKANVLEFDTILTNNLFGDILSDEAAMISGSIGMLPSASVGASGPEVFEPIHGSAPDIAGQDKANPLATVLSAAMLLRYGLGEAKAAERIENAVLEALNRGFRTGDIYSPGRKLVGCKEMGEQVLKAVESQTPTTAAV